MKKAADDTFLLDWISKRADAGRVSRFDRENAPTWFTRERGRSMGSIAGTVMIIPKTVFSVIGVSGSTQSIPLATRVPSDGWVSGTLLVRMHSGAVQSGTRIDIKVKNVVYTEDEPQTAFTASTALATQNLDSTSATGTLFPTALSTPIGSMVAVVMEVVYNSATSLSTFGISVDLVGRTS